MRIYVLNIIQFFACREGGAGRQIRVDWKINELIEYLVKQHLNTNGNTPFC